MNGWHPILAALRLTASATRLAATSAAQAVVKTDNFPSTLLRPTRRWNAVRTAMLLAMVG